jgi:hypothetical protein
METKNIKFKSSPEGIVQKDSFGETHNYGKMLGHFIALAILFFAFTGVADAQTASKLQAFYGWLKPIVNIVLAIATLYAVGKAIVKTFMKHQEAGMEWTMFVIALVLWGLWITFAGEIVAMFGGPPVNF